MWYDASVAASILEDPESSDVAGKMGYAHAPTYKTEESGWLWSWNLAVPETTKNADAATEFVKWATSKEYQQLVGETLGWTRVPPGARNSTYEIPEYKEAAAAFAPITLEVMNSVNPVQPGVNPQPWVGIQYVTIPEFQDVGNQVAQLVADAIAGRTTRRGSPRRGAEDRPGRRRQAEVSTGVALVTRGRSARSAAPESRPTQGSEHDYHQPSSRRTSPTRASCPPRSLRRASGRPAWPAGS